ncbi:MAG: PAS domain-containing protein [Verrucomicrobia bacterium]|nr:PAS domain-containing protein [Verrucomicrobiota bacterium]
MLKSGSQTNSRNPASKNASADLAAASIPDRRPPIRVLLIDDDEDTFLLTRRMLVATRSSIHLDWSPTYAAGLEAIRRSGHDVYLLDYRLGPHDGLELLQAAISLGCKVPIILLTTENPDVDAEAMRLGAADFLNKDQLDSALLERSIRYAVKHFATLRALRESEARFACFMQNVPCAVYMKDLQGRYVYVNETCEKAFNRKSGDWIGRTDEEIWPKSLAARFKDQDAQVIRTKQILESTEIVDQEDGAHYWISSKFPISTEPGSPTMLGGTGIDITVRKRLEKEFQEITEEEKRRLGQDLHDGLGQYLAGISFMAKVLQKKLAAKRLPEAADAAQITDLVNQTVSQTRDLARGLCPLELEANGLAAALLELATSVEKLFNVSCRIEHDKSAVVTDNAIAIHLYRIAQEAINNAVRHGRAKNLLVSLVNNGGTTKLTVKDDGIGLPEDFPTKEGLGYRVMNYRAGMIGATIQFQNAREGGATLSCSLPIHRNAEKGASKRHKSQRE